MGKLIFAKNSKGIPQAEGEEGTTYLLRLNPLSKEWSISANGKLIGKVKGYTPAQAIAQDAENKEIEDLKPVNTKTTRRNTKPAQIEETEEEEEETVPAVRKSTRQGKPVATAKPKKVKEFPDFDEWAEENVELLDVPTRGTKKAGIEAANAKTLKGARLKWGKERAQYNRDNGIETDNGTVPKTSRSPRVSAPKPEPLTKEERFGETWNGFGEIPSPMEYALAQLVNARASRDYGVLHGQVHPHSAIAQNSYYKAVERAFKSERRLWEVSTQTGEPIPDDVQFEYFREEGIPSKLLTSAPEGYTALEGYTEFYANGGNDGKKIKPPEQVLQEDSLNPPSKPTRTAGKPTRR